MQKKNLYILLSLLLISITIPAHLKAQGELSLTDNGVFVIDGPYSYVSGTFNGTINGEGAIATSLTFTEDAKGVFTFKNVNTKELIIQTGADVTIELTGGNEKNIITKITNDGTLFFKGNTFLPERDNQDITNNAFLTDSTASIDIVKGAADLIIGVTEGGEVHNEALASLTSIVVTENPTEYITFICQRKNMLWWNDLDTLYVPTLGSRIVECNHEVERAGQYRFRIIHEHEGVITSLISRTAEVKMSFDVILPAVEGATLLSADGTTLIAGAYPVQDEGKFDFYISLDPDYSLSTPLVTTSKKDTLEVNYDGIYSIKPITDSLTVFIDRIEPNNPSSNERLAIDEIIVKTGNKQIEIYTSEATPLQIFTLDGIIQQNRRLAAGNHLISISPGVYLLKMHKKTFKVLVK